MNEMKSVLIILCLAVFQVVVSEELPANFKRCSAKDMACLKVAIEDSFSKLANGIKELGIPKLDPIRMAKLTVGGGKIVQLVQNYENVDIIGLSKSKVTDVSLDLDEGKLSIQTSNPKIDIAGSYSVKGKILVLDVYGHGASLITLEDSKGKMDLDIQKYEKNGETYLKVTKMKFYLEPTKVHMQYDNLFDGNKQLGDNINNVLNDNWKEIYDEMKDGYLQAMANSGMRLSNMLFEKVPIKNIFLD